MSRTLAELIEKLTMRAACPSDITDALTEIDRRLTALETPAVPEPANPWPESLLQAAANARAKAVEDAPAVLEGRTTLTLTCTCRKIQAWDGTVRGFEPIDGCSMHGQRPEDVAAREAFAEAWKARSKGAESSDAPTEDEPVTAGQRAAALVMLGPELRADRGPWPTELARALSEAVDGLARTVRIAEETGEGRIAGLVRPALSVVSRLADEAARGGSST